VNVLQDMVAMHKNFAACFIGHCVYIQWLLT